ncbi:MAG: methylenetetrahydrofolate--tRNA-(uracil(54)-C(5))-methyltransferase (FADH(2)-oxidizing) TrmFO [Clostridia bacterium]|nr:methylenetetrahydrofolate--tRNA-(uracil(54)-C(5))-methyltransferase (FADH(2)-oxidizing) TrmFO [Clostridia bacterium]
MVRIIGGGLAGCEAAYQLLKRGYSVELYEMRPVKNTPAHKTEGLAELVCSNSLKSEDVTTSQGLLKKEMSLFGSLILECADKARVPAGGALAVDREVFSREVERRLNEFDGFKLVREEVTEIGTEVIVASGPLTSEKLSESIIKLTGADKLYFYDAVAPIVTLESVDKEKSFWSARYNKGTDDYLNCPMSKDEYDAFYDALVNAQTVILKEFEKREIFEGCMPVEVMAKRGVDALRFGPLRPVGIFGENGERYYAVVQLRKEDNYDSLVNLVGFQTNLTFGEQKRVFSMIPALHDAEFVRYGVMHRNTYINSPAALTESFNLKSDKSVFFAGQITGVEGYMESTMSGLIAGINMARYLDGKEPLDLPETSLCGSLSRYVANCKSNFQPMHVSFALLPPLDGKTKKQDRKAKYSERAINDLTAYLNEIKEA